MLGSIGYFRKILEQFRDFCDNVVVTILNFREFEKILFSKKCKGPIFKARGLKFWIMLSFI